MVLVIVKYNFKPLYKCTETTMNSHKVVNSTQLNFIKTYLQLKELNC